MKTMITFVFLFLFFTAFSQGKMKIIEYKNYKTSSFMSFEKTLNDTLYFVEFSIGAYGLNYYKDKFYNNKPVGYTEGSVIRDTIVWFNQGEHTGYETLRFCESDSDSLIVKTVRNYFTIKKECVKIFKTNFEIICSQVVFDSNSLAVKKEIENYLAGI